MACFSTLGLVTLSAWVTDQRTAQQIGALVLVPVTGMTFSTMVGLVRLESILWGAIGFMAVAVLLMLVLATRTFRREFILTRWH
jgi:hypothetical protein